MKILIFGASGATGRELVRQALEQGHDVTAFARDPARLRAAHGHLRCVRGDVLDPGDVERETPAHDAVVCAIGSPATKPGVVRSEGTHNIVRAMEKAGVRRLVCLASLGYGDSQKVLDRTPFVFRFLIAPLLLKGVFADHARQENYVRASQLDWIIVRPGNLTNGRRTGTYRHGFAADDRTIKVAVSRADVADFMLKQLTDNTYLRQSAGISD
jgi:putative NADH-flavin reductase